MTDVISIIDTLWVLLAAILVFFMNLGFASVEAGFARAKNCVNILSKNFIVFAVSSLGFMLLGWGLMFGGDNPFIGTEHLFVLGGADLSFYDNTLTSTVPFWGKFFFQLVFCGTAATIVSGAVAERIKYLSFILFSFVLTLVIYPIVGHWIWGGGWLADLGFMDFAGDAAVHSVGGWAALAGALILGPRIGKYGPDGKPQAIPGHNMSLAVIGLFVLWLGWFGFNPGSTMSFQHPADVMHILVTTNTAAIAAVLTSTVTSWLVVGKPDLGMTVNGCLAGLVGITGSCAYVSIESSLLIGAIAGVLVVFAVGFFDRLHVDDPVGATAVHLCCGVFGTLCVGLFAQEGVGTAAGCEFYSDNPWFRVYLFQGYLDAYRYCGDEFGELVDIAVGDDGVRPLKPDPAPVLYALEKLGVSIRDAVYIGDQEVDVITARNSGIRLIAAGWGFRGERALKDAGAETVISNVRELIPLISAAQKE